MRFWRWTMSPSYRPPPTGSAPQLIHKQLDYWTFLLGPKFSRKERSRMNLSRFYAISQIEYCRKFIFKRNFPIHKIFERSCEIGLWRLTANRIGEIFDVRLNKRLSGKLANSRFHHKPDPQSRPNSQLEAAYHKADKAIENIVDLLQAA